MPQPATTIGQTIKRNRETVGLSQKELAEQADVAPSTISAAENDRFTPSIEVLFRISQVLEVPFPELVEALPDPDVETRLTLGQFYLGIREYAKLQEVLRTLETNDTLQDYQQDKIRYFEAAMWIQRREREMEAVEVLYALSHKFEKLRLPDPRLASRVQNSLGNYYTIHKDYISALHHYMRALEIARSHALPIHPVMYHNISAPLRFLPRQEETIAYLELALSMKDKIRHPEYIGNLYFALGSCYEERDPQQSALNYQLAIPYYEQSKNRRKSVHCNSQAHLLGTATPEEKIAVLQAELQILTEDFTPVDCALTYTRLALVCLDMHDLPAAQRNIREAESLSAAAPPSEVRAYCLLTYARCLMAAQEYEAASSYAFEAADMYASLRFFYLDLQKALALGREAIQRLRAALP